MKEKIILTIDAIIQFGLKSDLQIPNKVVLLERYLVKIYNLYFEIESAFDETDYLDFDKSQMPDIRTNVTSNFPEFGWYKMVNDINNLDKTDDILTGDAIDDLSDIIIDLVETKWRIENNSYNDGVWYFKLAFETHTKQHILDLLNCI